MSNILVSKGGGIWEGVYMTLAVAAYHWFLLHWSENLHPRFQIPKAPSVMIMHENYNCVSVCKILRLREFMLGNVPLKKIH